MSRSIEELVTGLGIGEKVALLAGADMWSTVAVDRLGIPSVLLTDGPNGARGPALPASFGGDPVPTLCLPCGAALGATWDGELLERVGGVIGREARTKGCRVLLAPTVNLHRSPLGGRNFESYSEDPVHAGRLGAAFVRGVQAEGVIATVKHFAGNETETDRFVSDTVVDERTLREVHLPAFEHAVRDGGAKAVMTAYNRLNGVSCAEHGPLMSILRDEWGFDGIVMTDWYGVFHTAEAITHGLDLEMPGPGRGYGAALEAAIADGSVDVALVDAAVARLLRTLDSVGALDDRPASPMVDGRPAHRAVAREAASAAITLLANDGSLPLVASSIRRIALVGPAVATPSLMGGGSSSLVVEAVRTPLEALAARLGPDVEIVHEPALDIGLTSPELPAEALIAADGEHGFQVAVLPAGQFDADPLAIVHVDTGQAMWFAPPAPDVPPAYSVRAEARFRPTASGRQRLSLVATGPARLLLDGVEILARTVPNPPPGHEFLGFAWREITVDLEIDEQVSHDLTVEMTVTGTTLASGFKVGVRPAPPVDGIDRAVAAARSADATIVMVGTNGEWESEMRDRTSLDLPGDQDELVSRVLDVAPSAIVVLNTGAPVALPWADRCGSVLQAWFGGEEMAEALADVLIGAVDPGGRLPHTMPRRLEDNPTWGNFPAELGTVRYGERMWIGHRWYEARSIPVTFPFGHGLSYTTFDIDPPAVSATTFVPGDTLTVRVTVTNTGSRSGSEVVQLYVAPRDSTVDRPVQELKAFAKVHLEPGASQVVEMTLDDRSFAHWQPDDPGLDDALALMRQRAPWNTAPRRHERSGWVIDPGRFDLHIGRSSADIRHVVPIDVRQRDTTREE